MSIIYVIREKYKEKDNMGFLDKDALMSILKIEKENNGLETLDCYYIDTNESILSLERMDMDTIKMIV